MPGLGGDGYDCPDCGRGVFGVGSGRPAPPPPRDSDRGRALVLGRAWDDGSIARYGETPAVAGSATNSNPQAIAHVEVPQQRCHYDVWSYLGREHLEVLLDGLRVVAVPS